jgi:hypothetical protein
VRRFSLGRRLAICTAVAVAAVLTEGVVAVLLLFLAIMLAFDSVIPVPGMTWSEADDRFCRLVRRRRHAAFVRRLHRLAPERLDLLDDQSGWASIAERRALGVQLIPIESVTGTVEAFHARLYDRSFRPDAAARERWKGLWMAHARGAALPPISVYRVNGQHIVRDGHHRLSVARDHGDATIEADVVELRRARAGGSPYAAAGVPLRL